MGRRHIKPEQIIHMLREAEIKLAGGQTMGEVCRELGISEQTYYRWRKDTAACRYCGGSSPEANTMPRGYGESLLPSKCGYPGKS